MLNVKNISKTYPGENYGAVVDISFNLREQEIFTLVGKSGSGKSTLLQMLAGLMKPDSGEIIFQDEPLENPEEQLVAGHAKIKMVFQDYKTKIGMSVEENIRYMLLNYNDEYKKERTEQLLLLCGLEAFRNKKPNELSGGQLQRLSIARALADEPELLLMDEPFSNLDPITKENLMMSLREIIKTEHLSIIFVTHDTRDALMISDRIAYISNGRILQLDTVDNIYHQPNSLEIASFFGRVNSLKSITGLQQYIRAEDMTILSSSKEGVSMEINSCYNIGHGFLLHLAHKSSFEYYIYSQRRHKVGQKMSVGFDKERVLSFG